MGCQLHLMKYLTGIFLGMFAELWIFVYLCAQIIQD